jgi:hypothetical protein
MGVRHAQPNMGRLLAGIAVVSLAVALLFYWLGI